ncbi:hypothetical protein BDQ17DRAFT_1256864, partial [Cyathus striatus]
FDDFVLELVELWNRIGQGDPLSIICYILYNADLLDIPRYPYEDALGYVDDSNLLAEGNMLEESV